jgi:Heterokaryon incompatibility protein (HET)
MNRSHETAETRLCFKCTKEYNLKTQPPCPRHPDSGEEGCTILLSQIHRYLYEGILSDDSIRLLQLEHGHDDQPIKCNLVVKHLDNNTDYNALSYHWGDQTIQHEISCDGQPLKIGENLHSALW